MSHPWNAMQSLCSTAKNCRYLKRNITRSGLPSESFTICQIRNATLWLICFFRTAGRSTRPACPRLPALTHAFGSLFALQNVYLHTKSRKKPCLACIFSHIFPFVLFAECTSFKLLVSCKIKTLKFQGFQLYTQSPTFYPAFLFFALSHYLAFFTRGSLKKGHLVCLYTF